MGQVVQSCCDPDSVKGVRIPKNDNSTIELTQREEEKNIALGPGLKKYKMSVDDFNIKGKLGEGGFGKVLLVEKKDNGQLYALKKVKKAHFKNFITIQNVMTEKNIMLHCSHPFIVKLFYSFQDEKYLYYCMEYINGGVLFNYLKRYKTFPENTTKFYIAEVILALKYMHENMEIIYRDLKPENILLDEDGHIKITDFGLSKS